MNTCLSDATIASFVDRRLSQAEQKQVYAHLAVCAYCTKLVAETFKTKEMSHE